MVENKNRLISIVVPVYNEAGNIFPLYDAVISVFRTTKMRYDLEIIFSDNHSNDKTFEELEVLAQKDTRVKVIRYNRNYGFQKSLLTAYRHTSGNAAIQIDCDQQDPPSLLSQFLELWEDGHDVVVGVRESREESRLLTWCRRKFYVLLNLLSEDKLVPNAGDFRLVDRTILDKIAVINHHDPYVRGLIDSLAINGAKVLYNRSARYRGSSKFPIQKLFGFARDGIIAHSILPLRLATYVGLGISIFTFLLSGIYLLTALVAGSSWPRGFATTTILILFGIGINGIFLGILGEYIARIYHQTRPSPITVVERSLNLKTR